MDILDAAAAAKQSLLDIFKPTTDAIDAIVAAAGQDQSDLASKYEADITDLQNKLAALNTQYNQVVSQYNTDEASIADLKQKLADAIAAQTPALTPVTNLSDMQMHLDWQMVVQPDVAPMNSALVKGTDFGYTQKVSRGGSPASAVELWFNRAIVGDYSGFLIALHRRPVERPVAKLVWKGRIYHDDRATSAMQALEFDTLITKDGQKFNLSSQINYAKGGMLQIVNDADGVKNWEDSGIIVGKLAANAWHDFMWEYWYDTAARTFGYTAFTLDGKRFPITGVWTSEVTVASTWTDGIHSQLQIGTNSKGLPFAVAFDKLSYSYAV